MTVDESAAARATKENIRAASVRFAARWADAHSEAAERQTFWNDFFAMFDVDRRRVAAFESLAQRASTGNRGWIDMLNPGQMAVEHKSAGEDLDKALQQLLDYLPSLSNHEMPWLLVASDFQTFKWQNLSTGDAGEFALADLPQNLHLFMWIAGYNKPHEEFGSDEEANLFATQLLANVHDRLADQRYPAHDLREWMTRILFVLFADDTGVWDRSAVHTYIALHTRPDGSDLGQTIALIFDILNTPLEERQGNLDEDLGSLTYVNGDLFAERLAIPVCDRETRDALLFASVFNWSTISPAIFGSLFQNVMQPADRRQLGAHYTTEANILKTIRPLFLDDLETELERAKTKPALRRFMARLGNLNFLDPACGCGNFLVVAYRELRRLETDALRQLRSKEGAGQLQADVTIDLKVSVDQFCGIELEEFPAKIARTALYLADHIANRELSGEFGQHIVRFPIPVSPTIEIGNALRVDWNDVLDANACDYVLGNPPFVGISLRTEEQTDELESVWGKDYHGSLDYVTAWYRRSAEYLASCPSAEVAFVSTNSITQGEQVAAFWKPLRERGFAVSFAHRTFSWTSEARGRAHVHVVIVGIAHAAKKRTRQLHYYNDVRDEIPSTMLTPATISAYLLPTDDVVVEPRSKPLCPSLPEVRYGNKPTDGGGFIVTVDQVDAVRADPIAAKYLRPFPGARELLHNQPRWCLWLADAPPQEIRQSTILKERVAAVRAFRLASKAKSTQEAAEHATHFRQIAQPVSDFLCIPRHVSQERRFFPVQSFPPDVIASDANFIADDPDSVAFGILSSSMFIAWFRMVGGRIKSDLRFNKLLVYNTFPAPALNPKQVKELSSAAADIIAARSKHPGASLADLYDPTVTPPELTAAHTALDKVVDRAIAGRRRPSTELDRQTLLLEHYRQRVESGATTPLFDP